ncbi:MAG: 23S rRNA pseudouridine(955/2504/2580) synthase RluC [Oleiphilaceae bacterium]|nr:23S rRNA pseudouridine(955/2504/2580) synthase RluC [Oleiphilaceae bacterium]
MTGHQGSPPQDESRTRVQWVDVDEDLAGQRLDNFLMARLRGMPKSVIYRIIRKGEVRVNKGRAKPAQRVQAGDQVRIPPVREETRPGPAKAPPGSRVQSLVEAAVVHETPDWLVVNKPSGLAVHGGSGLDFGLIEALRASRPQAKFLELVHRLDRDTSGLVMVARKRSALVALQNQMRHKRIHKVYHALVAGSWPDSLRQVDGALLRYETPSGERRVRIDEEGKESLTRFRVLERFRGYTLVEASPVTGRTHQIRVHAASAGHPIAGDSKYMDDASNQAFRRLGGHRLMLHAAALEVMPPGSEEKQRFEAPEEPLFAQILTLLREREKT